MTRGGFREGAGAKPLWKNLPTTTVRVPKVLSVTLRDIAKMLDNDESLEEIVQYLVSAGIKVEEPFSVSANGRLSTASDTNSGEVLEMLRKIGIEGLFYITHFDNVSSILEKGILSHSLIERERINYKPIYNSSVNNRRANRAVSLDKTLWDFANLYFQPRNAMLYSLVNGEKLKDELAILCVKRNVLTRETVFVTDGNAASQQSRFFSIRDGKTILKTIREQVDNDWWKRDDGSKRKIMAECLVPNKVAPSYIQSIYVASDIARNNLLNLLEDCHKVTSSEIPIAIDPKKFFQPDKKIQIEKNLSIVKGDMFFSRMQTLTISVNCVGVMGKGLASTAKYRFPDVYVKYEDLCKSKRLSMGVPYLHKRESSVFDDLYDEYLFSGSEERESQTWFLLFPTKRHWKNISDISGIEAGLQWICDNYEKQGIRSLAMPALGCGLGQLSWQDVGPLMCKYLLKLDIPVAIYLPTERNVEEKFITPDFLLSRVEF